MTSTVYFGSFDPGKAVFFNLATHMTPVCDCFGFTGLPILLHRPETTSSLTVTIRCAKIDSLRVR